MPAAPKSFGTCCTALGEIMRAPTPGEDGLEPLVTVGDDGVLYMATHLDTSEPDELGTADHPVYFCPFCGTGLQTPAEVDAKSPPTPTAH
jgi:hypothetical protein